MRAPDDRRRQAPCGRGAAAAAAVAAGQGTGREVPPPLTATAASAGGGGGRSDALTSRPPTVSVKKYNSAVIQLTTIFAAYAAVSSACNSIHGTGTVVMGLLNAARFAKNITSLARASREAARIRVGCRCKHKGKCKYSCKCGKSCKCKYWRDALLPSYEWLRKALSGVTEDEAMEAFKESTRKNLLALHRARKLRGGQTRAVAFDKHPISRAVRALHLIFGLFNGHVGWHEVYMTAQILIAGERITIAVVSFKKGMGNHEAVRLLLEEIRRYAPDLEFVLADKEFCNTQVINEIKAAGMKYLMAHPHSKKTDAVATDLERGGRRRIAVSSVMKSKGTRETAEYDLVGTLSRKARDGKWKPEGGLREKYVFYATSNPRMDVSLYASRWGIETGYRMDESIRARTASRSHGVRVFFFLFTLAVHNMHVVMNAVHTGNGAHRYQTLQTVVQTLCDEACIIVSKPDGLQCQPDPGGGEPPPPAADAPCGDR